MSNDPIHLTKWWRFDRCEIQEGAVRGAPGTQRITYNPWERFESLKGKYRTVNTLWGEFVELSRQVREASVAPHQKGFYWPSATGQALILKWCNTYGLLGILPGTVQSIALPPTWEAAETVINPSRLLPNTAEVTVQRTHARVGGVWNTLFNTSTKFVDGKEWKPSNPAPGTALLQSESVSMPARTIYWDWEQRESKVSEGNLVLRPFFWREPHEGQYPVPLSPEFWEIYHEPLDEWTRIADVFREAVELVSRHAADLMEGRGRPENELSYVHGALALLNVLASSEAYYHEFYRSRLQRELSCASFLSALAGMFLRDLMAGRRALRCGRCEKIFVSNDRRAVYCSVKCRNTAQMGRYRRALKG